MTYMALRRLSAHTDGLTALLACRRHPHHKHGSETVLEGCRHGITYVLKRKA